MRKNMALALAGALILSLATAGVAQAVNSHQSVAVTLAHSKAGTAAKPKSVGALTVDMNVRSIPRPGVRDPLGRHPLRQEPRLQQREVPQLHRGTGAQRRRPRAPRPRSAAARPPASRSASARTSPSPPSTAPAARRSSCT